MFSNASGNARLRVWGVLGLMSLASLLGCGGGAGADLATGKVSGKISAGGQPVTGGELTFAPIGAGKNGSAKVGADGTFTVSTYGQGDGAVIGKHKVTFTPPAVEAPPVPAGGHTATPASPYAGMAPKEAEITISKGDNTVDIELVKKK